MLKNFLIKNFIKSKLKGVPDQEIDRIIEMVEKNPDFFKEMGEKLQQMTANGMSQEQAVQKIFAENRDKLQNIIQDKK
jgi:uncharacterized Fe-S cluster-containing radical SAM superfamily protein